MTKFDKNYTECSNIKHDCQCTDRLMIATQNGQVAAETFSILRELNPCCQLTATRLDHKAIGSYPPTEKKGIWLVICLICRNLEPIFTCRVLIFGLLKSNIKVRQDIPEFLTGNLLSIHIITFNLGWSWIFSLSTFVAQSSWAAHKPQMRENWELAL